MNGKHHIFYGIGFTIIYSCLSKTPFTWEIAVGGIIGSLLPDIDHKNSLFSKKTKIYLNVKHRGFTHSLLFLVIFIILYFFIADKININLYLGFLLGILSHILTDFLTPAGIRFFYPAKVYFSFKKLFNWLIKEIISFLLACFILIVILILLSKIF